MLGIAAVLAAVSALAAVAVRVRKSIAVLVDEGRSEGEAFDSGDYELVSLLRRLEEDRRALAVRLRFCRWLALWTVPPALALMLRPLGPAPAGMGFVGGWMLIAFMDAGWEPWRRLQSNWGFRLWVRFTEGPVRLVRPLQRVGGPGSSNSPARSRVDAESRAALAPLGGALGLAERRLLRKLLASTAIVVSDIMTPWARVSDVNVDATRAVLLQRFRDSGHSRLPVRRDKTVVGVVHVKDALTASEGAALEGLSRPPYFVRQESVIQEVLDALRNAREHLAVVLDRLGRPVGVVTIEDILEELVGELYDEREKPREAKS